MMRTHIVLMLAVTFGQGASSQWSWKVGTYDGTPDPRAIYVITHSEQLRLFCRPDSFTQTVAPYALIKVKQFNAVERQLVTLAIRFDDDPVLPPEKWYARDRIANDDTIERYPTAAFVERLKLHRVFRYGFPATKYPHRV
jgi:hypothetical protein